MTKVIWILAVGENIGFLDLDLRHHSINDRNMTAQEYFEAKKELPSQQKKLCSLKPGSSAYKKALASFLESLITVKGHAWCTDIKSERRKMATLIAGNLPRQKS